MTRPAEATPQPRPMRWQAFRHALNGLRVLLATQPNARFHAAATVVALVLGGLCGLQPLEWIALTFAITLVVLVEGLNTAIEFLVDIVSPERQRLAGWAKDVAAGAVLLASICAVIVGGIIFGSRLLHLW